MSVTLKNRVVLITGANRGLGKALVESAIEQGAAKVYLGVRDVARAAPLVERFGDKVVALQMDLGDQASIAAAAGQAQDVSVVINNAGVLAEASVLAADAVKNMRYELEINTFGFLYVAQAFAEVLKSNGGALVQINSVASMKTFGAIATYSASKAASYALTQALREELAPHNVQVLSVHPGPIDTDMLAQSDHGFEGAAPKGVADNILATLAEDEFHSFPDATAQYFVEPYKPFADNIVLAQM